MAIGDGKRLDQFNSVDNILLTDLIPIWKTATGTTSQLSFGDFVKYVVKYMAEEGLVGFNPGDSHYYLYKFDSSGVLQPVEDLGTVYPPTE